MQRKIFIAIGVDEKTKKFINKKVSGWKDKLPVFWTNSEGFHITLAYLGFIDDEELMRLCENLKKNLQGMDAFDVEMERFCWGPSEEKPKMVWLKGGKNKQLSDLRKKIEQTILSHKADWKDFSPHITIGRIGKKREVRDLPEFCIPTKIIIPATSVEVMESIVEKRERKYITMESIELN